MTEVVLSLLFVYTLSAAFLSFVLAFDVSRASKKHTGIDLETLTIAIIVPYIPIINTIFVFTVVTTRTITYFMKGKV